MIIPVKIAQFLWVQAPCNLSWLTRTTVRNLAASSVPAANLRNNNKITFTEAKTCCFYGSAHLAEEMNCPRIGRCWFFVLVKFAQRFLILPSAFIL